MTCHILIHVTKGWPIFKKVPFHGILDYNSVPFEHLDDRFRDFHIKPEEYYTAKGGICKIKPILDSSGFTID